PTRRSSDLAADLLVLVDIFPAGHGDLDERHFPQELGMRVEDLLERPQPQVDAFRVVEAVYSEDDGLRIAQVPAQVRAELSHLGIGGRGRVVGGVDGDRDRLGSYLPVVVTERAGRPGGSGELAGGGGEVERRPAGLESEIVGAEQALEDLTAPGDPLEDLRWRE